jgi:hypothetical protein
MRLICVVVGAILSHANRKTMAQNVTIRTATPTDIPAMAKLWQEKMILQQQFDRRYGLLPDSDARWSAAAARWLDDDCCRMVVAVRENCAVGYIIGWIQNSPPGLTPEQIGVVTDMTVGLHSYQGGLGRLMLEPLRGWFMGEGITQIIAQVPSRQPVEQAFWRALGATELSDLMWIKL